MPPTPPPHARAGGRSGATRRRWTTSSPAERLTLRPGSPSLATPRWVAGTTDRSSPPGPRARPGRPGWRQREVAGHVAGAFEAVELGEHGVGVDVVGEHGHGRRPRRTISRSWSTNSSVTPMSTSFAVTAPAPAPMPPATSMPDRAAEEQAEQPAPQPGADRRRARLEVLRLADLGLAVGPLDDEHGVVEREPAVPASRVTAVMNSTARRSSSKEMAASRGAAGASWVVMGPTLPIGPWRGPMCHRAGLLYELTFGILPACSRTRSSPSAARWR